MKDTEEETNFFTINAIETKQQVYTKHSKKLKKINEHIMNYNESNVGDYVGLEIEVMKK